jgi:RNA polymerase sigma factor (sigma-70 family)
MQDANEKENRQEYRSNPQHALDKDGASAVLNDSDEELVRQCCHGNQEAWTILIDKYKNLIFSIPLKYGLSRDEAGDILQEVCLKLLEALPQLREPRALAAWLIKVTSHECVHWRRRQSRQSLAGFPEPQDPFSPKVIDVIADEVRREQALREAVSALALRCRELIQMLFFTTPAVPYEEVAQRFGVAKGSIGFIRMRCLKHLRRRMELSDF